MPVNRVYAWPVCWGLQVLGTAAHNAPGCLAKHLGAALIISRLQFSTLNCDLLRKNPRYASDFDNSRRLKNKNFSLKKQQNKNERIPNKCSHILSKNLDHPMTYIAHRWKEDKIIDQMSYADITWELHYIRLSKIKYRCNTKRIHMEHSFQTKNMFWISLKYKWNTQAAVVIM